MTELDKLRNGDDWAARLLRAGSAEQPKPTTRSRAERALGLSGVAAGALLSSKASATVAASSVGWGARLAIPTFAKWLALGMLAGGVAVGGATVVHDALDAAATPGQRSGMPAVARAPGTAPAHPAQGVRTPGVSAAASAAATDVLPTNETTSSSAEAPRALTGSSGRPIAQPVADAELPLPNGDARLSHEVELLERVRATLRAGNSAEALAELDAIGGEIRSLTTEADLLRVEALLAHGDRARAEALAAELRRRGGGQNFRLKRLFGDP
ncbi:MAG TPA: hypothetical protein VHM25_05665 [Polyangiaceae bacterium]|nr:hypothetical protein [Polyangiaceae bacterium]